MESRAKPRLDVSSKNEWMQPSEWPVLLRDEVHVWRVALCVSELTLVRLEASLSESELERSQRFRFARDRRGFIVTRAALRQILADYLGCSPRSIRFSANTFGKPVLATDTDRPQLEFNVSHSGEFALVAIANGRCVGVDVEQVNPVIPFEEIAVHVLSSRELAVLGGLPAQTRLSAFVACWTRKEAYAKACGHGLSVPPDRIEVTIRPDDRPRLIAAGDDPAEAARWALRNLSPGTGYVAALVARGHSWRLSCWDWNTDA